MMSNFLARANEAVSRVERVAMVFAMISMTATMLVIVADVVMRYVFLAPFPWSYQLIQYNLLVALYFLAIAETQKRRENISVHVLEHLVSPQLRRAIDALVSLLILVFAAALLYVGSISLERSIAYGEFAPGLINWPKWPSYALFVGGTLLFAIRLVVDFMLSATGQARSLAPHADSAT